MKFDEFSGGKDMLAERKIKAAAIGQEDHMEDWLRAAFVGGIEAAEAKKAEKLRWPDSAVEADRTRLHALGVML